MKNITKTLFALLTIVVVSCTSDDVQDRPSIQGLNAAVLSAPEGENIYVLSVENASQQAERFVWSDANYDGDVLVTYEIEIDLEGANFATPQIIGSTNSANQLSVSVETLNTKALSLGVDPFIASTFEVRIKSSLEGGLSPLYSNVAIITITPYTTETPKLYVVGNFLAASGYGNDWTPGDAVPISASGFGETDFEGYVNMNVASIAFLFLPTNTSFDGKYGDDGSFAGALAANGADILTTGPGYYLVKADTSALTYSIAPASWAITGSATPLGWPDGGIQDQDMTYNAATKKWEITLAMTSGGAFKFRANDAWDLNLGADNDDADTSMNYGGPDLTVPADGTYLIELDLSQSRNYQYTATLQ